MSLAKTEILKLLPQLSPADAEEVRTRLAALLSLGGAHGRAASKGDSDETTVLRILVDVLKRLGVERGSVDALRASSEMPAFRKKLPGLFAYMDQHFAQRKIQREAFLAVTMELLYRDLVKQNIPISARVMVRHMHRLPAVINQHFPGYAEAGMLHHLIKMEIVEHRKP